MSCCGKKVNMIIKGNFLALMDKLRLLPEEKYEFADTRIDRCRECGFCTWMTWNKYWKWVDENGGKKKFFAEIDNLTKWPLLPKQRYDRKRKLFCRVCKCWVPAKAFLKNEQCPKNFWEYTNV
jgi:hypothetical protein